MLVAGGSGTRKLEVVALAFLLRQSTAHTASVVTNAWLYLTKKDTESGTHGLVHEVTRGQSAQRKFQRNGLDMCYAMHIPLLVGALNDATHAHKTLSPCTRMSFFGSAAVGNA